MARAQQDKARYDNQMANYIPPPGHDARGNVIEDHRPRRRTKRGPKDPAAPKRASGAYVFFTNEMRPIVMKQFPGIKFVEMGRILGERWRALTPTEKKRFEDIAAEDKVRFQMEMQQYTANQAAQQQQHAQALVQQQHQPVPQHHIPAPENVPAANAPAGTHHYAMDPHQYQYYEQYNHHQYH